MKDTFKRKVYLDASATTPVDKEVLDYILPYFSLKFGNPSSLHSLGREAKSALEEAREKVANFLGCSFSEVFFTSSATESNNLVLKKVLKLFNFKPHYLVSAIEHSSVLNPAKKLAQEGKIDLDLIKVSKDGILDLEDLKAKLKENTVLVSVSYVNSEIGTIQPLKEIAQIIREHREKQGTRYPFFHVDAVQAVNFLDCKVSNFLADFLVISAHKIYGPKGASALFKREDIKLDSWLEGGEQEFGLRSSTENIPAILGLAKALELVEKYKGKALEIKRLRDKLLQGILAEIGGVEVVGSLEKRIPNNLGVIFKGVEAEILILALDKEGIMISSGSACTTREIKPSETLLALGKSKREALSFIRFSLPRFIKEEDIDYVFNILPKVVKSLKER